MRFDAQVIIGDRERTLVEIEHVIHRRSFSQRALRFFYEAVFARRRKVLGLMPWIVVYGDKPAPRFEMAGNGRTHSRQLGSTLCIIEQIAGSNDIEGFI